MIYRWVKKFKGKETVLKLSAISEKVTTGRQLSIRVPGNVHAVRSSVGRSPRKSIRKQSRERMVAILNTFLYKYKQQNCWCYELKLTGLNCYSLE